MLNFIIDYSIKNKLIIGLLTVSLVVIGIFEATKLPIDAVPDITNNQVLVITQAPAYGATDIERLVTFPIEQANSNISGLKEIRSFSRFGLSLVTMVFEDDIDVYWARQQVSERLQKVQTEIPSDIGTRTRARCDRSGRDIPICGQTQSRIRIQIRCYLITNDSGLGREAPAYGRKGSC